MPTAPTMIRGAVDTLDILQTQRKFDVSDMINLLEPSKAPLLRLTGTPDDRRALIKTESATDPEYRFFRDQLVPRRDQINNAAGYSAVATVLTVDNGNYWVAGDIALVSRTGERMRVTNSTATTITVTRNWGAAGAAAMVDNDELLRTGIAVGEGSTAPTDRTTQAVLDYNYIQEFRWPFQMTRTQQNTTLWTGKDWVYQGKKAGIEFALMLETSFLWGVRNQDSSGALPVRTSGGILQFVTQNTLNVGNNPLTEPVWEQFTRRAFRYNALDNKNAKVMVCSPLVCSAITSWAKGKQYITNPRSEEYGMSIMTWFSGHGTIHLVPHWLFHDSTEYNTYGFVLDTPNMKARFLQNCQMQMETNIQPPGTHTRQDEYWGYYGWQIEQDDTHARLSGVAGY